jgi:hypothetical protein
MKRLLTESSADADVDAKPEQPNLSHVLTEEILKVDRQLLEIQTAAEELSGIFLCGIDDYCCPTVMFCMDK